MRSIFASIHQIFGQNNSSGKNRCNTSPKIFKLNKILIASLLCSFLLSIYNLVFSSIDQPKIIAIAAGWDYSSALMSDGTVFSWGFNGDGQLGLGISDHQDTHSLPKKIPYLSNITAIAAGWNHALALDKDGKVWAWGNNSYGQLGNGEIRDKFPYGEPIPNQVKNLSDIVAIAAGEGFSLALDCEGRLYAWGLNTNGQLGIDNKNPQNLQSLNIIPYPLQVEIPAVKTIAAGAKHVVVLDANGSVWTFGSDSRGQLGDGRGGIYFNRNKPSKISGLAGVTQVAAGHSMSLFLKQDGTIWAVGQFNTEAEAFSVTPTKIQGLPPAQQIFCGPSAMHVLVVDKDGICWVWGLNTSGQLGDGSINEIGTLLKGRGKYPPLKLDWIKNIIMAALGGNHSLALDRDGSLWAWGNNWHCQLGIGKKSRYEPKPQKVIFMQDVSN
ncbi:MAG: RCC1 domain-containing protein [Candidatus Saccharicenans sp.]